MAFTIAGEPAALQWEANPVAMNADEALAAELIDSQPGPEPEARNQAVEWLREYLETGPKATKDVKAEAKAAGFAWRTIWRAKSTLPVKTYRDGYGVHGGWWWRLESKDASHLSKCATKDATVTKDGTLGTLGTDWNNNKENGDYNTFLTREAPKDAKCAKLSLLGEDVAQFEESGES